MTALHPTTDTGTVRIRQTAAPATRVRTARASGLVARSIRVLFVTPRRDTRPDVCGRRDDVRDRREALGGRIAYGGADRHLRVF
ncbi:hypothetical protein [uncultured Microbacterium sp.]|uniref:hypothetical protein n=1 Tax=uncultured Microbacterium sp. TaxID=191216 RepID=UPI0028DC82EE|nr:hypothetical protein [uncultured Microbacterium sp.]